MTTCFSGLRHPAAVAVAIAGALFLSGCVFRPRSDRHQATSVVQFLYPGADQPVIEPAIPTLHLPLRVGVAFVPPAEIRNPYNAHGALISEMQKTELLQKVSAQFKALPFVQSIEVIPTTYLRPGGGFSNLDQLRTLMGIDVVALVAYDQAQNTSETPWSLSYWTIVGAYLIPAEKNDTYTLMEAVVYDIPSRNLLFRAPGSSASTGHSTLIRTEAELTADSGRGMAEASADLTVNLQSELARFQVRVREEPQSIHIERKAGYRGGGNTGSQLAVGIVVLFAGRYVFARRVSARQKSAGSNHAAHSILASTP